MSKFCTRYNQNKFVGMKTTEKSKVDSVNFRTLEDRIKEFMRSGQVQHTEDLDEDYDLPEEDLSAESEEKDASQPLDPLNVDSLDKFDVIDLYNKKVNLIEQTEENAKEVVRKINENSKNSAKEAKKNTALAKAISNEMQSAAAKQSTSASKAEGK